MSDPASSSGSSSLRPQQDEDEQQQQQQQSPHEVPSSPHLRPRAHRSASPTASSSTATTSSTTLAHTEGTLPGTSLSPQSSSSSGSSSRGSVSERGTASHRGDLTASVISNLDLNEYMASPSLRGQVDDAASSMDEAEVLKLREGVAKRLPLVREDTSTRRAIEEMNSPGTEEQTSSTVIGDSSAALHGGDNLPHHPMFDRLEPPNASLGAATSSSSFSRESSGGAGLTALLTPDEPSLLSDFTEAQEANHRQHQNQHRYQSSDDGQEDDDNGAAHQPKTTSGTSHVQTVPTVSSTGMPRLIHRHADDPTLQSHYGSQGAPPKELLPEGSTTGRQGDESESDSESESSSITSSSSRGGSRTHTHAPTGSLILTALSPSSQISWGRRLAILSSSFFVNLGLPFINGVCLGFGEIFARTLVAPLVLGIVNSRWPQLSGGGGSGSGSGSGSGRVTTNVGRTRGEREELRRETGSGRGIGTAGVGVRATSSY
ncbi:hypothetical protein BCV69DRAFT_285212 [Microstroma glucosiphilum]|uniref:TOM13-domain-containing protein n=1 Tax=Pseudomicrostroma glucosiphilum TaxID=1684307 RepID=A0A316TY21_9BASI|nr:hypothetical protein BCV69DRAFT_285212 [Pseudomicrostroma glucosiphilum]PWN18229.1 hypothetical protein BCV69DRAFT_285212 [Pseudomicrostroma glucosiphilum]